jgi:hypothetical protein
MQAVSSGEPNGTIVLTVMFSVIPVIIWTIITNNRRKKIAELQTSMQTKLLEKFGNSQELLDYLRSEAGQKFMESAAMERARPAGRILGSIQAGLILTFVGIAILAVRAGVPSLGTDGLNGLLILGSLAIAIGLGFLSSAVISFWLSKAWGLMDGKAHTL